MKKLLAVLLVIVMILGTLAACQKTPSADDSKPTDNQPGESKPADKETDPPEEGYKQAPMFDDLVADGTLAPVEERLPKEPFVQPVVDSIGTYGGTFYIAGAFSTKEQNNQTRGFYEPFLTWNYDLTELTPNLLSSFEANEDFTEFTLTLREGLRWSDGDPVTTDDIRYTVEDVYTNTSLMAEPPTTYAVNGELAKFTFVDDYTFKMTFAGSFPALEYTLCAERETTELLKPSHYLKQFNDKYTPVAELDAMAKEKGYDTWVTMYEELAQYQVNPDLPTLHAWMVDEISADGLYVTYTRNPYYHKVDEAGNQLPYMDAVQWECIDNEETLELKALSGDLDYHSGKMASYSLYAESATSGNYYFVPTRSNVNHPMVIFPNAASQDPQKGPLLSNTNFRGALSHAIDRQKIVDMFYTVGDIVPDIGNFAPIKGSPYYNDYAYNRFLAYDVATANKMLDDLGLTKRGADGYRLGLDGKDMIFLMTIPDYWDDTYYDVCAQICGYWKAIGLNVEYKVVASDIWSQSRAANELDFTVLATGAGGLDIPSLREIRTYAMISAGWNQAWAHNWAQWMISNGEQGIEPPAEYKKLNDLCNAALAATSDAEQTKLIDELVTYFADLFPCFVPCHGQGGFSIVSNDIKNGPTADMPIYPTFTYGVGGTVYPCQWYKEAK